jgi:hypothetical protein
MSGSRKSRHRGKIGTVVPMHDELKPRTLKSVLKLAKVDPEEFAEYLQIPGTLPPVPARPGASFLGTVARLAPSWERSEPGPGRTARSRARGQACGWDFLLINETSHFTSQLSFENVILGSVTNFL